MPKDLTLENPLAIIGDEDVVLGFRALGFRVYVVRGALDFREALEKTLQEKIAVCLIQENIFQKNLDEINNYRYLPVPIFLPFAKDAKADLLNKLIKNIRLKATGALEYETP